MKSKSFFSLAIFSLFSSLAFAQAIQFPAGSTLRVVNDHVEYQLPSSYIMTGVLVSNPDIEMKIGGTGGGSVKCDCTSRDGDCKPFAHDDQAGCSTTNGSCKTCTATSSASLPTGGSADFAKLKVKYEDPNIMTALSLSTRVVPLTNIGGPDSRTSVTDAILNQQAIQDAVNEIYNRILTDENRARVRNGEIPANHKLSPFTFDGAVGFLVLPDAAIGLKGTVGVGGGKKYTCSGCSGSCKHDSSYGVHYCDGCSSGCTLSWN